MESVRECPNCKAILIYNEKKHIWRCEYCRGIFDDEKENKMGVYTCKNCKTGLISLNDINECIYCGSKEITKKPIFSEFNPGYLVPLNYDKNYAINKYKKHLKSKSFVPRIFKKSITNIKGVYIPFWLYDYEANGNVKTLSKKNNSFKSTGTNYVKTDIYESIREAKMELDNIPVVATNKIKKKALDTIGRVKSIDLKEYDKTVNPDFLIYKCDIDKKNAKEEGNKIAKEYFKEIVKKDITGYDEVEFDKDEINLKSIKTSYALLPVWMLNIKYKNKVYEISMNGQTGKIYAEIPKSKGKMIMTWILIFILIFVPLLLVYFYVVIK